MARIRLAMEGISAWLENSYLVLWVWYYSNAVGGVKVFVPEPQAERAWTILHPPRETDGGVRPPRTCPACQMELDQTWITCWHCGCSADGERDPAFFEPPPRVPFSLTCSANLLAAIVGMSGPLLFLMTDGYVPVFLFWVFAVVLMLGLWSVWKYDEGIVLPSFDLPDGDETFLSAIPDAYAAVEEGAFRSWKAAVFSMGFPPLALYSLWVLIWLDSPDFPLRPREQRRCLGALVISLFELGIVLSYFLPWWMWVG